MTIISVTLKPKRQREGGGDREVEGEVEETTESEGESGKENKREREQIRWNHQRV